MNKKGDVDITVIVLLLIGLFALFILIYLGVKWGNSSGNVMGDFFKRIFS